MSKMSHRSIVDIRSARVVLSRFLLPLEIEQAGIINTFGRTLAQDLIAEAAVPPCNTAAIEGYAVIAEDTAGATAGSPRSASILSSSTPSGKRLESGTVMYVRKDDPLPDHADAVVAVCDTYRPDRGAQLLVLAEAARTQNVILAGSISAAGTVFLPEGIPIGATEMETMASLGRQGVPVRRRPRVSIITSGADVVDSFGDIGPGERRNASRYALIGMVLGAGCDLGRLIHVRDGRIGIQRALGQCDGSDVVIVCISPREKHDLSLEAISAVGARHFDRVQMEPGNCGFGIAYDRPVFAIENRCSLEAFELIIRPGLMMLLGRQNLDRPRVLAKMDSTLRLNPGAMHCLRAVTSVQDSAMVAKPTGGQTQPNSLILIPENEETVKRGESVEAILLS